jgi:hypothetical protein
LGRSSRRRQGAQSRQSSEQIVGWLDVYVISMVGGYILYWSVFQYQLSTRSIILLYQCIFQFT